MFPVHLESIGNRGSLEASTFGGVAILKDDIDDDFMDLRDPFASPRVGRYGEYRVVGVPGWRVLTYRRTIMGNLARTRSRPQEVSGRWGDCPRLLRDTHIQFRGKARAMPPTR
jgi:hypothetical protein